MGVGDRIRELRELNNLTQEELAIKMGYKSKSTINKIEQGINDINQSKIIAFAKVFDTTPGYIMGWTSNVTLIEKTKTVRIKVYGSVPAGVPVEAFEDVIDWEEIPIEMTRGGKEYIGLVVKGNSMEPDYKDGDIIIILLQPDCENGEHCVVFVDGDDATFKKVVKKIDGSVVLQALNPIYDPLIFSDKEVEKLPVRILGKAVELRRKMQFK